MGERHARQDLVYYSIDRARTHEKFLKYNSRAKRAKNFLSIIRARSARKIFFVYILKFRSPPPPPPAARVIALASAGVSMGCTQVGCNRYVVQIMMVQVVYIASLHDQSRRPLQPVNESWRVVSLARELPSTSSYHTVSQHFPQGIL